MNVIGCDLLVCRSLTSKRHRSLWALLATMLVVLIWFVPVVRVMRSIVVGDGGDNYQFLGFQFLSAQLFKQNVFQFGWTNYWRYPVGIDLQTATDCTLISIVGLLLYPLLHDPVVVYNSTVLILLLSNVLVTFWAFRTWFDEWRAATGALVYGLSFYSLAKVGGHVNLLSTAGFPMLCASVYRVYRSRGAWTGWLSLGLSGAYLAFSSLQYPLIVLGSLPILLPVALWYLPKETREFGSIVWQGKRRILLTATGLVFVFCLFHGHKLLDLWNGRLILPGTNLAYVSIVNWFVPNAYIPTLVASVPNGSESWIESCVFLGYVEMILFTIACTRAVTSPAGQFLLASTAVTFILSIGDPGVVSWLWPYSYLFSFTPFRGVIEPARLYVLVYLGITMLILMLLQHTRNGRILAMVFVLLSVERFPRNVPLSATLWDASLVEAVQRRPTNAVLDFPVYSSWWFGSRYDLYSVYYKRPIVGGYVHWSGDYPQSRSIVDQFRDYRCNFRGDGTTRTFDRDRASLSRARITEWLLGQNIRTVVVHKDLFPSEKECGAVYEYVMSLFDEAGRWEVLLHTPRKQVMWLQR